MRRRSMVATAEGKEEKMESIWKGGGTRDETAQEKEASDLIRPGVASSIKHAAAVTF